MSEDKKHGLYKVVAQADKLARIVMDQLAKDGCGNLENIRDAMLPALVAIERENEDARRIPAKSEPFGIEQMRPALRRLGEKMLESRPLPAVLFGACPEAPQIEVIQDVADGRRRYCRTYRGARFWTRHPGCKLILSPDKAELENLFDLYRSAALFSKSHRVSINHDWYITPKAEIISGLQLAKGDFEA